MSQNLCYRLAFLLACVALSAANPVMADQVGDLKSKGKLLFADDFNRDDGSSDEDAMGNGWTSNSPWRADGQKQAFLDDGSIRIVTAPGAGHAVTIFHDIEPAFQDCVASFRYRMNEPADTLSFDFNDPKCKTVHSGHLVIVKLSRKAIQIQDSKTGTMNLEVREKFKDTPQSPGKKRLMAATQVSIPFESRLGQWYDVAIRTQGDLLTLFVDGKEMGELRSPGISHPTKRKLNIGAKTTSPDFDDLQVHSLDQ
ncbi:hypothetical protein K227x_57770 [Rubripirellula lacrimiformis]|uniref:3-keto-disaccharide hydrolase domain-containing protein n=1 Tax=Rubripirellula lacrimiformis TaxID=1930273 RepID=A0A517NJP9_9BACT|nr:LamG domain-containing protein [Rubripirellula lacrimiformis]QDT07350.1 hypothetical protein K227x_57770 [Rubripirellula lacrimiformis]